ncbi:hypothetical protein [Aeromicrobium sp. 179-A 4D2 NHS]|uniref:hypothetical protein n=1 Tax=Aeromicrobium sp. 179-A 4D2 NHS TaxID=3142375 RepID=UPI0039A0C58E
MDLDTITDPEIQAYADIMYSGTGGDAFADVIGANLSKNNSLAMLIAGDSEGGNDFGAYITNDKYDFALIYAPGGGLTGEEGNYGAQYPADQCDNPEVAAWKQSLPTSAKKDGSTVLVKGDLTNIAEPPADWTPIC